MKDTHSLRVYIAASFKHRHGVRLLGRELERLGYVLLDWTEKAVPPPGLTPAQRRLWMDTDQDGGQVYEFCRDACATADLVIYYGESGQDAGVEIGIASASGAPILGVRGPLEGPGLMLHGAVDVWTEDGESALAILERLAGHSRSGWRELAEERNAAARELGERLKGRRAARSA